MCFNKKLSRSKEVGFSETDYGILGDNYANLGQLEEAMENYNESLSMANEVGNRYQEGLAYGHIALVYARLGNLQEALRYCNKPDVRKPDLREL